MEYLNENAGNRVKKINTDRIFKTNQAQKIPNCALS